MNRTSRQWRLAYWWRVSPGRTGLSILLVAPAVLLLPLGRLGFWEQWFVGATVLAWLGAFVLAALVGRDSGAPSRSLVWLYQKGISPADQLVSYWLLDAALGTSVVAWWGAAWLAANAVLAGEPIRYVASFALCMELIFLIGHAFLFPLAALGSKRGVDLLALLALLAMLQPVLQFLEALPQGAREALHWVLPPLVDATRVGPVLAHGLWTELIPALAHILAWLASCLMIGIIALRRWRPVRP
ncbi:MAG: hypothetical protein HY703_04015 [Gemmatimonadetes bacterium]|nr:hypothetical protein [Gemmatimonadota bacterium]